MPSRRSSSTPPPPSPPTTRPGSSPASPGGRPVSAIRLVAHAGRIVQVGISKHDIPVPIPELTFKELDLLGSRNSLNLMPDGLSLLARHEQVARSLITHRFSVADVNHAYELMRSRREYVGRVLVQLPAAQG